MAKSKDIIARLKAGDFKNNGKRIGFYKLPEADQKTADEVMRAYINGELGGVTNAAVLRSLQQSGIDITHGVFDGYLNVLKKQKAVKG